MNPATGISTGTPSVGAPSRRIGLGATWLGGRRAAFLVWAPAAEGVEVALGDPPDRFEPLEPRDRGYHRGVVEDAPPGTPYRFRLDGGEPLADPASRRQPGGVHGPSAVFDPAFDWTDDGWPGVRLADLVLYEIHVGAFTPEGTLDAIVPRLGALADLGVTAIELMPVMPFPGDRNWGYDGVFPHAVHESYGGPEALQRLVDAAHAKGLGVVLDVVHNHFGPEGNVVGEYGPYFTDVYATPWGDAINFDGPGSDEVRRFFIESAIGWVRDFHVDGLRLDATDAIHDTRAVPFLEELGRFVHLEGDRVGRRVLLIAESDDNDPRIMESVDLGGLGLDGEWNDDFHHALHAALTGERQGYYVDFGPLECLEWALSEGFVYAGQYSEYRGHGHGRSSRGIPAERHVVFAQNHDQVGNRAGSERLVELADADSARLAAAATLLGPYVPLLFMGEEYGETAPFPFFTDFQDAGLGAAVRTGRRREFAKWSWKEIPDPQAAETFAAARIDWARRDTDEGRAGLELYAELLRLRRAVPALAHLDKDVLEAYADEDAETIVLHRWTPPAPVQEIPEGTRDGRETSEALVVLHFGEGAVTLDLLAPPGRWEVRLDTAATRWGGPGSALGEAVESDGGATLALGPRSAVLLTRG